MLISSNYRPRSKAEDSERASRRADTIQSWGYKTRPGLNKRKKTLTVSFRIQNQLKKRIADIAAKERRTLSSLLDSVLRDFLKSYEDGLTFNRPSQGERRRRLRKKVLLPARWRMKQGEELVEYDVVVKDMSDCGAYTEYIDGRNFSLLPDLQASLLALVIRMPGSQEPVALDCETKRIHLTKDFVGVGLRFNRILIEDSG